MPAARQASRSLDRAFAVTATIRGCRESGNAARMRRVVSAIARSMSADASAIVPSLASCAYVG
jgi:hypothetical protein